MFFTFQSGYIPMKAELMEEARVLTFTFQSGYIPIRRLYQGLVAKDSFTFQSGYIPMVNLRNLSPSSSPTLHSNLVIFQSDR